MILPACMDCVDKNGAPFPSMPMTGWQWKGQVEQWNCFSIGRQRDILDNHQTKTRRVLRFFRRRAVLLFRKNNKNDPISIQSSAQHTLIRHGAAAVDYWCKMSTLKFNLRTKTTHWGGRHSNQKRRILSCRWKCHEAESDLASCVRFGARVLFGNNKTSLQNETVSAPEPWQWPRDANTKERERKVGPHASDENLVSSKTGPTLSIVTRKGTLNRLLQTLFLRAWVSATKSYDNGVSEQNRRRHAKEWDKNKKSRMKAKMIQELRWVTAEWSQFCE